MRLARQFNVLLIGDSCTDEYVYGVKYSYGVIEAYETKNDEWSESEPEFTSSRLNVPCQDNPCINPNSHNQLTQRRG